MGGAALRARRELLQGRHLQAAGDLPAGLPVQAAEDYFPDEDIPPEHQHERDYLPGHTERQLEPGADDAEGPHLADQLAGRPEPVGPADARGGEAVQCR